MMFRQLTVTLTGLTILWGVSIQFEMAVDEDAMVRCHTGYRDGTPRCKEYANLAKREVRDAAKKRVVRQMNGPDCNDFSGTDFYDTCEACKAGTVTGMECRPPDNDGNSNGNTDDVDFPELGEGCITGMEWGDGTEHTEEDNWGNCFEMEMDETHRYITSNNVPDFYYNPYCPIGLGQGYCIQQEIDNDACAFTGMVCGADNMGEGTTAFGDVWVAQEDSYKIKLEGNPTLADRPGDMYDASKVDGAKTAGPAVGVAINGMGIYGPNDAGDVSIDEARFQLACGGHVTPPEGNDQVSGASTPPKYHFHKAAECLQPFTDAAKGLAAGGEPTKHAGLMGWAMDGFGIYAYQEEGGGTPVVDECGGHFGPVDTGEVVYHYHSRTIVPYTLACQGPALGKCADTQRGTNYCHYGCGAEVCVQPGTDPALLKEYLDKWDSTWLSKYTVNNYTTSSARRAGVTGVMGVVIVLIIACFSVELTVFSI